MFGSLSLTLPLGETLQDWEDDTKWTVMDFWCGSHFSRPVLQVMQGSHMKEEVSLPRIDTVVTLREVL